MMDINYDALDCKYQRLTLTSKAKKGLSSRVEVGRSCLENECEPESQKVRESGHATVVVMLLL